MSREDGSAWQPIRTFFPLFEALMAVEKPSNVLIVGASDGKFVLPLAAMGIKVTAVDVDGEALLVGSRSLKTRAAERGLDSLITCRHEDIRDVYVGEFDAIWTSCSWHYSRNFDRPLSDFVDSLKKHTKPGGVLGAEYMAPIEIKHVMVEHYLEPGEVWGFIGPWERLWDAYTTVYREEVHPGQENPHVHRMGLAIARRPID